MTFDEVWTFLQGLRGRRFHTLDQHHPFTLEEIGNANLVVRVERTGRSRPIPKGDFSEAWNRLTTLGQLSRTEIHREISPFNPAYVSTLLTQVPGVHYRVSPIVLSVSEPGAPVPPKVTPEAAPMPSTVLDDGDVVGGEEIEESVADRLAEYGARAGFQVLKEWRTEIGNRIDLVWARPLPSGFLGFKQGELLPIIGFEIETSWRSRKHIKGDIFNLQDLSSALGVIVLCRGGNDTQAEIDSLRAAAERYVRKLGLRIHVWSDADVDKLCSPQ